MKEEGRAEWLEMMLANVTQLPSAYAQSLKTSSPHYVFSQRSRLCKNQVGGMGSSIGKDLCSFFLS